MPLCCCLKLECVPGQGTPRWLLLWFHQPSTCRTDVCGAVQHCNESHEFPCICARVRHDRQVSVDGCSGAWAPTRSSRTTSPTTRRSTATPNASGWCRTPSTRSSTAPTPVRAVHPAYETSMRHLHNSVQWPSISTSIAHARTWYANTQQSCPRALWIEESRGYIVTDMLLHPQCRTWPSWPLPCAVLSDLPPQGQPDTPVPDSQWLGKGIVASSRTCRCKPSCVHAAQ